MKNLQIIIEIPKGSNIKYEYDRSVGGIVVDRILREGFKYPANYGYIEEALDWDGDELDVLVYSDEKFIPGVKLNVRIVGAMKMIDQGETDTKLIGVHADDYRLADITELKDIPQEFLDSLKTFFTTYKNWKGEGQTDVTGFADKDWAEKEYDECVELMNKYKDIPKKEFIQKMMKEHPEKYI